MAKTHAQWIVFAKWIHSGTRKVRARVLQSGLANRAQAEASAEQYMRLADEGWKPARYTTSPTLATAAVAEDVTIHVRESSADRFWIADGEVYDSPVTDEQIARCCEESTHGLESLGICMLCGNEQDGCEPDARGYKCEACESNAVYGAEQLAIHFAR